MHRSEKVNKPSAMLCSKLSSMVESMQHSRVAHPAAGVTNSRVLEVGDLLPLGRVPTTLTSYCKDRQTHNFVKEMLAETKGIQNELCQQACWKLVGLQTSMTFITTDPFRT